MADSFGKPLGAPRLSFEAASLKDLEPKLQERMPAVRIAPALYDGVRIGVTLQVNVDFAVYPSKQAAEGALFAVMERLQAEAIYGLGLRPRLQAMEDQVQVYRDENRSLKSAIARKDALIASQQEQIASLMPPPEEYDDFEEHEQ